jgi:hypothetical protein
MSAEKDWDKLTPQEKMDWFNDSYKKYSEMGAAQRRSKNQYIEKKRAAFLRKKKLHRKKDK